MFAEFGDKTNLILLALMSRTGEYVKVVIGGIIGISLVTLIGVIIGVLIGNLLPVTLIGIVTGVIFIGLGISILISTRNNENEENMNPEEDDESNESLFKIVYAVSLAEFGDKSQIFIISAAANTIPLAVFFGAIAGMSIIFILTAILGGILLERVPQQKLEIISGLLFIIAGLWFLVGNII